MAATGSVDSQKRIALWKMFLAENSVRPVEDRGRPVDIIFIFAPAHDRRLRADLRRYQGLTRRVKMATPNMKMAADAGTMKKPLSPNNADVIFEKKLGPAGDGSSRSVEGGGL